MTTNTGLVPKGYGDTTDICNSMIWTLRRSSGPFKRLAASTINLTFIRHIFYVRVRSGDSSGQLWESQRPIHLSENCSLRYSVTCRLKCARCHALNTSVIVFCVVQIVFNFYSQLRNRWESHSCSHDISDWNHLRNKIFKYWHSRRTPCRLLRSNGEMMAIRDKEKYSGENPPRHLPHVQGNNQPCLSPSGSRIITHL